VHPQPSRDALTAAIAGNGIWHTHEWIGAVLPGSRLAAGSADAQAGQITGFLDSATTACRSLLGA
jgi:hypothetical protein